MTTPTMVSLRQDDFDQIRDQLNALDPAQFSLWLITPCLYLRNAVPLTVWHNKSPQIVQAAAAAWARDNGGAKKGKHAKKLANLS